jgi:hypothetical protein
MFQSSTFNTFKGEQNIDDWNIDVLAEVLQEGFKDAQDEMTTENRSSLNSNNKMSFKLGKIRKI